MVSPWRYGMVLSCRSATLEELEQTFPDLEEILPLTPLQRGLAFESLAGRGAGAGRDDPYHVQLTLRFAGPLKAERLQDAWKHLVARHAALRLAIPGPALECGLAVVCRPKLEWNSQEA
jgi:hypothetical protein